MSAPAFPPGDPGSLPLLLLWAALWLVGGIWLVTAAFRLPVHERFLVGFGVGWVLQTLFANMLSWLLPFPWAAWLGAVLVLLFGAALLLPRGWHALLHIPLPWGQIAVLMVLAYTLTVTSRGLALFDDYAHMPTLSIMATGEIPPHFALDPAVPYGYHYFLMLFSAEVIRIGGLLPWAALDLARGVSVALSILLGSLWVRRLTGSLVAGWIFGIFGLFASGTRWLLLLLPEQQMYRVSAAVQLIGSGVSSSSNLAEAMVSRWGIDGMGPFPIPFAYTNGIVHPGFLSIGDVNGAIGGAISAPLLLTFNRWNGWRGALVSSLLLAAGGLLGEVGLVLGFVAWALVTALHLLRTRRLRLPASLWQWWLVLTAGNLLAMLQGGAWTDLLAGWLGASQAPAESYQTIGFQLGAIPSVVSSHLGVLPLSDSRTLLVAAAEVGPILLMLPLIVSFAWKSIRAGRWYEASVVAGGLISFAMLLIQFTGSTGVRNTSRLYGFVSLCYMFAPLAWIWVRRRGPVLQTLTAILGLVLILGGVVSFSAAITAAPRPQSANFINNLDVQVMRTVWNRLEPGTLVFDPDPFRAPTVTGRYMDAHRTWFESKPEYQRLQRSPLLSELRAAGYDYMYFDDSSWLGWSPAVRQSLASPCVRVAAQAENPLGYRRLLDLRACPGQDQ